MKCQIYAKSKINCKSLSHKGIGGLKHLKTKNIGWRGVSMVKNTSCSSRGPKFTPQNPCQLFATASLSIQWPRLAFWITTYMRYILTNIDTHIYRNMYQIQQLFPCIQVHSFNFLLKKTTEIENRCFSGLLRGRVQERCEKSFRFRPQKHTKHGYVDYKLHRELFVIFCVCVYMCVCVCVHV